MCKVDTVYGVRAQVLFVWYRFYAKKFPLSCRRHAGSRCEAFLTESVSGLASGYIFLSCRILTSFFFSCLRRKKSIGWHASEKQSKFSSMYRWHSEIYGTMNHDLENGFGKNGWIEKRDADCVCEREKGWKRERERARGWERPRIRFYGSMRSA